MWSLGSWEDGEIEVCGVGEGGGVSQAKDNAKIYLLSPLSTCKPFPSSLCFGMYCQKDKMKYDEKEMYKLCPMSI